MSAAAALCFCSTYVSSQEPSHTGAEIIGVGAYPLSFSDASAWFAQTANDHEKVLTAMVYFHGTAGWTSQSTNFKWEIKTDPATIFMKARETAVDIKYWRNSDEIEVMGKRYKRTRDNVFLVDQVDSQEPVVTPIGEHNLAFGPDDIPAITLLRRDASVWAIVTGMPREAHPLGQKAIATDEVVGWDKQGLQLLLTGDAEKMKQGCELFRRAAQTGYAPAQYRLGYCYESGQGATQDFAVANTLYEKAGEQGYVDAQYKLAHSYRTGRGTKINLPLAIEWYKKAAHARDKDALSNLGWMYATGQGTPVDQRQAYACFLEAAKAGDPASQLEVGERLVQGNRVQKDLALAYSWFLVLNVNKKDFPPEDWKRVEAVLAPVDSQLDHAARLRAEARSEEWMKLIAQSEMQAYARQ